MSTPLSPLSNPDSVTRLVRGAIERATAEIVEEEAKAAGQRVERRVRETTAFIAARVLERFSMQHRGNELLITVQFPGASPQQ